MTEAAAVAGFSAEAVLVRTAEALDATSGARGQTGRQQDDAEDRSILGRESAEEAAWLGLSVRVPRGPLHPARGGREAAPGLQALHCNIQLQVRARA